MAYSIAAHRILEILQAAKCLQEGETLENEGEPPGILYDVRLALLDEGPVDLRFRAGTSDAGEPERYSAALILANERVRGVDYNEDEQRQGFRITIPAGWHQNIINPHLPRRDLNRNRHDPLPGFAPADFADFVRQVAELWRIELTEEDDTL